jgi:PAB1-binding protein PBP1
MTFMFRSCALGATLGAAMIVGSGIGAADPASTTPANPFLAEIAAQIGLPAQVWTASGTHTARGYTSAAAQTTSVEGMRADCDNINLNKKLSTNFLSGVFAPGLIGFFYKCENISPDTNKYWFTIAAADPAQIDKLCDPATTYQLVYDQQHDTYWIDEPFTCTDRHT